MHDVSVCVYVYISLCLSPSPSLSSELDGRQVTFPLTPTCTKHKQGGLHIHRQPNGTVESRRLEFGSGAKAPVAVKAQSSPLPLASPMRFYIAWRMRHTSEPGQIHRQRPALSLSTSMATCAHREREVQVAVELNRVSRYFKQYVW